MSTTRLQSYVPLIRQFASNVTLFHSRVAAKLGLHPTDLKGFRLLGEESMSAGGLAERTGLTGASVTALIDRLEKAGYVVRERGADDGRRVTVHAIPEKIREVDRFYKGQHARMSKLLSKYSASEFSLIAVFLKQTTQVLAKEAEKLKDKLEVT